MDLFNVIGDTVVEVIEEDGTVFTDDINDGTAFTIEVKDGAVCTVEVADGDIFNTEVDDGTGFATKVSATLRYRSWGDIVCLDIVKMVPSLSVNKNK